jgi:hypothetical protein
MATEISDSFWLSDLNILIRHDRLLEFFISSDQTLSEKLNSIARFGIYISVVLAMYHSNPKYLTLSILTFLITYLIYINVDKKEFMENNSADQIKENIIYKDSVKPTINNPFGNSSVIDIIDNPTRKPMADYSENNEESLKIKEDINDAFNYNLYRDVSDVYGIKNSQRQYYTTPSRGNIPADPKGEYKKWLYGSMASCKDNQYKCLKYENLAAKRQVFPNPLANPNNEFARNQ